eukprot:g7909.t1
MLSHFAQRLLAEKRLRLKAEAVVAAGEKRGASTDVLATLAAGAQKHLARALWAAWFDVVFDRDSCAAEHEGDVDEDRFGMNAFPGREHDDSCSDDDALPLDAAHLAVLDDEVVQNSGSTIGIGNRSYQCLALLTKLCVRSSAEEKVLVAEAFAYLLGRLAGEADIVAEVVARGLMALLVQNESGNNKGHQGRRRNIITSVFNLAAENNPSLSVCAPSKKYHQLTTASDEDAKSKSALGLRVLHSAFLHAMSLSVAHHDQPNFLQFVDFLFHADPVTAEARVTDLWAGEGSSRNLLCGNNISAEGGGFQGDLLAGLAVVRLLKLLQRQRGGIACEAGGVGLGTETEKAEMDPPPVLKAPLFSDPGESTRKLLCGIDARLQKLTAGIRETAMFVAQALAETVPGLEKKTYFGIAKSSGTTKKNGANASIADLFAAAGDVEKRAAEEGRDANANLEGQELEEKQQEDVEELLRDAEVVDGEIDVLAWARERFESVERVGPNFPDATMGKELPLIQVVEEIEIRDEESVEGNHDEVRLKGQQITQPPSTGTSVPLIQVVNADPPTNTSTATTAPRVQSGSVRRERTLPSYASTLKGGHYNVQKKYSHLRECVEELENCMRAGQLDDVVLDMEHLLLSIKSLLNQEAENCLRPRLTASSLSMLSLSPNTRLFPDTCELQMNAVFAKTAPGVALRELATESQKAVWIALTRILLQLDLSLWPCARKAKPVEHDVGGHHVVDQDAYLGKLEDLREEIVARIPGNLALLYEILAKRMPNGGFDILQIVLRKAAIAKQAGEGMLLGGGVAVASYLQPLVMVLASKGAAAIFAAETQGCSVGACGGSRLGEAERCLKAATSSSHLVEEVLGSEVVENDKSYGSSARGLEGGKWRGDGVDGDEGMSSAAFVPRKEYSRLGAVTPLNVLAPSGAGGAAAVLKDKLNFVNLEEEEPTHDGETAASAGAGGRGRGDARVYRDTSGFLSPFMFKSFLDAFCLLLPTLATTSSTGQQALNAIEICVDVADFLNADAEIRNSAFAVVVIALDTLKRMDSDSDLQRFKHWLRHFEIAQTRVAGTANGRSGSCAAKDEATAPAVVDESIIFFVSKNVARPSGCIFGDHHDVLSFSTDEDHAPEEDTRSLMRRNIFQLASRTDADARCREKAAVIAYELSTVRLDPVSGMLLVGQW